MATDHRSLPIGICKRKQLRARCLQRDSISRPVCSLASIIFQRSQEKPKQVGKSWGFSDYRRGQNSESILDQPEEKLLHAFERQKQSGSSGLHGNFSRHNRPTSQVAWDIEEAKRNKIPVTDG
ncbi:hypothetical protein Ddye_016973 [Dipteronia dyeriana]|uniref:Uncharacterized protein n=1 Tax=Dipteronia dyeriana TaxID=168575 RepID=A0AAD9WZD0_9ROSI|nr:hypothetical protein Ddye_016973 [Dipteronia dyeriana]